jgi:hypothetical protein
MDRLIADQANLVVQLEIEGQSDLAELAQQHLERLQTELEGLKAKRIVGEMARRPKATSRPRESEETKKRSGS